VSPWARWIGTPEDFAAQVQLGIEEERYDRRDMPVVLRSMIRWVQ